MAVSMVMIRMAKSRSRRTNQDARILPYRNTGLLLRVEDTVH